ncbi:MAG: zf-HC2 domain-containing protein, partial [Nocardioidaceae bacterium]
MSHLHCKVSALIDGELTGAARKRALAHVRSCSACRDEVAQTLSLKHRLSQMASVEPPGDLQSLLAGAETITCTPRADHLGQRALMLGRTLVVVGSVSVIVLTIAYVVGGPQRAPATKVSPPVDEFTADFASSVGRDPLFYPAVGTMTDDLQPTAYTSGPAAEPTAPAYPRPQSKPRGSLAMSGIQPPAGDEQSAVKLLRRAARAPERLAFQVTRRVKTRAAHGPNAVAVRIRHVPGQGTTYGVTGSGSAHSVPRFVPESKSHGARRSDAAVQRLVHSYDVGVAGPAVVDGRRATMVSASQAGQSVAKFWIDNETGLVLRRETYDAGRPVRSSHLVKLHVSRHGFLAHLPPALETPQAAALSMRVAPVLNDKGWVCPESLSGDFG